jgi:hypothetical protein
MDSCHLYKVICLEIAIHGAYKKKLLKDKEIY